jgi:integration host factor subunit alpha
LHGRSGAELREEHWARGRVLTVTKADLADTLFNELGLNRREGKEFVELFFEKIRIALETGDSVKFSGFGNFEVLEKKPRPGRNPKTGDEISITARRVVTFKASQKLKDHVATNADALRREMENNKGQ